MKRIFYVISLATLLLMASCGNEVKDENAVIIGKKKVIEKFPASDSLKELAFNTDEIGNVGIKVIDSLMIVSHFTNWSILSSDGSKKYGDCLQIGQGPVEFTYIPWCGSALYSEENDSLVAYVPDIKKGHVMSLNLTDVINGNNDNVHVAYKIAAMGEDTWDAIPTAPNEILLSQLNKTYNGARRLIFDSKGNFKEPEVTIDASNMVVVNEDNSFILGRETKYDSSSQNFVEAMYNLNQLNVYSKDGKKGFTITVGRDKLDNLSEVEALDIKDRKETYRAVSVWPVGFGATYSGLSYNDKRNSDKDGNNTQIQFFDWDGNPIFLANEPYSLTEFDIDFDKKILYAIDPSEDKIRAFDATPIIEAYNRKK